MTEQSEPTQQEKEAILPDGIGLTLEQAKMLISEKCGIRLGNDEPALMGITICNAYLGELQKLHARHQQGLAQLMTEKTQAYVAGVNTAVDQLSASLTSASVEGIRKVFDEHAAKLTTLKTVLVWASAIISASALINVVVFMLRGMH